MVKIDLGVHLDGFPVVLAHTIFIGECKDERKKAAASAAFTAL